MDAKSGTSSGANDPKYGRPVRGWLETARKDPAVWLIGAIGGLLIWYVAVDVRPDINNLQQRNEKISDSLAEINTNQKIMSAQLAEIKNGMDTRFGALEDKIAVRGRDFDNRFVAINNTITGKMIELEAGFRKQLSDQQTTLEENLGEVQQQHESTQEKLSETDDVVAKLDQQESDIETINKEVSDTTRKVTFLSISEQVIDNPILQKTLLRLSSENPLFSQRPEDLIRLWSTRKQHKASDYLESLINDYKIDRKAAMLIVYDSLTEKKPIRYFVEASEIKAKARTEPKLAALKPEGVDDADVPLAQPLSIARVCEEKFQQKITECYEYFLSIANTVPADEISLESPSDEAVLRLIVETHGGKIPNS